MRVPSTSASPARRTPRQTRATLRRTKFLEVAAALLAESGYDAVTMTAIANRAGASIGTLYDYFPDKRTLALALLAEYTEQADAHWDALLTNPAARTKAALANLFIEGALTFVEQRPAYLPLLNAPILYARSPAARQPLRRTIAAALQRLKPSLPGAHALLIAQIIVELIKALFAVYKLAPPKDRPLIADHFKTLMRLYLLQALR